MLSSLKYEINTLDHYPQCNLEIYIDQKKHSFDPGFSGDASVCSSPSMSSPSLALFIGVELEHSSPSSFATGDSKVAPTLTGFPACQYSQVQEIDPREC